jgi:hypothetical protein
VKSTDSPIDSVIVSSLPELLKTEWPAKQFLLLYRGSRDGFDTADFHRKCDGHGRTMTLIQDSNNYLFGGYTPVAWAGEGGAQADPSLSTFVFTLTNPHKLAPRKFALRPEVKYQTIYCERTYGPVFGGTFYTRDGCTRTRAEGSCNYTGGFESYFINDSGVAESVLFTGSEYFAVKEMEVFEIKD